MSDKKKKYVKPQLKKLNMLEVSAAVCCRRNGAVPDCSMVNKTGGKSSKYNTQS
ncbi:MAG: hypothetical protein HZC15_03410 [Candidatus Omnitrophica bacterium]|nr:hypothetical protein [Candidatus Omnitrophota bacterium]